MGKIDELELLRSEVARLTSRVLRLERAAGFASEPRPAPTSYPREPRLATRDRHRALPASARTAPSLNAYLDL